MNKSVVENMLEELLKEINELKEYKERYELANKDKERMSEMLYHYMMVEYESMTREEKVNVYRENSCSCCRYRHDCTIGLPEDIWKPIPSDIAWIPSRVSCGKFKWS
jgi:hypothetical protein